MAAGARPMLALAKQIYRSMPLPLRKLGFGTYAWAVREQVRQKDLGGYVAELHLSEVMEIGAYLEEFEPDVKALIDRFTPPGGVALDIGANVGLHPLRIAYRLGSDGRLFAFEPTDFSYRKLRRNVALNPHLNIQPIQIALSNENAKDIEIHFRTSWRTDGGRADVASTRVDFLTLDDWASQNELDRLDLIKIDVDGYEGLVIEGGLATISKFKPVFLIEAFEGQFEQDRPEAFLLLESLGYSLYHAKDGEKVPASEIRDRLRELRTANIDSFNVLAKVDS